MIYRYVLASLMVALGFLNVNSQINLDSSLVAYYKLDGNTSDASTFQVTGTPKAIISVPGKSGIANTAYGFNGSSSQIDCGVVNRGILETVTISAWIKTNTTNLSFIVGKYDWIADKGYHLFINNGKLGLAGRNNGGKYMNTMPIGINNYAADGNWHFAVAEITGNSWALWMDCIQVAQMISNAAVPILSNSESLTIGYYDKVISSPEQHFDGVIDEVRIYNRVLSVSERSLLCDINYEDSVVSSASIDTVLMDESNWVWPNIFTPNGDGINDNFVLEIPYKACLTGSVYNRWGVGVYECKDVAFSWNGRTSNGEKLPAGVYFYMVSYCVNDETISRKGTVTLMRGSN